MAGVGELPGFTDHLQQDGACLQAEDKLSEERLPDV